MLAQRFDESGALMGRAKEEVLAFSSFLQVHWRQIWSTNPLERLNKEIKRRSRVVGIFPNEAAAIRLCGAVTLDINDEWLQPNAATSQKPLWQICTQSAMMTTRHPESSCSPSDRHRDDGFNPQHFAGRSSSRLGGPENLDQSAFANGPCTAMTCLANDSVQPHL
jgi:hypothetical protein